MISSRLKLRVNFIIPILTLILVIKTGEGYADIHLQKDQSIFHIFDLKGFTLDVFVQGHADATDDYYYIYFTTLESISDIIFYTSTDNLHWEKQKTKNLEPLDAEFSSFYDGLKYYSLHIDKGQYFKLTYTLKCKEIMLLSAINVKNRRETDSLISIVSIRQPLVFSWYHLLQDSTNSYTVDSTENFSIRTYTFSSIVNSKITNREGCSKWLYCMVHSPGTSPDVEFGLWHTNLNKSIDGINQQTKDLANQLTEGITDTLEITRKIFEYVKKSVSYIDIEVGYGAWKPIDADNVLLARKGDCKGMANLIYQLLKYKGVDCYYAVMPTLSKTEDFIFPSLASTNHAICVVSINQKWYFLDATDNSNLFELPSRHSQGRTVFCINDSTPFLLKVPVVSPEVNKTEHTINLNISDKDISGTWDIVFEGHSAVNMLDFIKGYSESYIHEYFDRYFKLMAPKFSVQTFTYKINDQGQVTCHAEFKTSTSMISSEGDRHYMNLKYLPISEPKDIQEGDCLHYYMYTTQFNDFKVNCLFTGSVRLSKTRNEKFGDADMMYTFNLNQPKDNEIDIQYLYKNAILEYDKTMFDSLNKLSAHINKSNSTLIIYE